MPAAISCVLLHVAVSIVMVDKPLWICASGGPVQKRGRQEPPVCCISSSACSGGLAIALQGERTCITLVTKHTRALPRTREHSHMRTLECPCGATWKPNTAADGGSPCSCHQHCKQVRELSVMILQDNIVKHTGDTATASRQPQDCLSSHHMRHQCNDLSSRAQMTKSHTRRLRLIRVASRS